MRGRLRDAIRRAGGSLTAGTVRVRPPPAVDRPFVRADLVEHDPLRAIDVRPAAAAPQRLAFLDGIQRYAVVGWIGDLVPVVRATVAAAVLCREDAGLRCVDRRSAEFLVAPLEALSGPARAALADVDLELVDAGGAARPHPILDVQRAAEVVERRRADVEREVGRAYLASHPGGWLVVDGGVAPYRDAGVRVAGLVKSHETQYLPGAALRVALTLPEGHRTSAFAPGGRRRSGVVSWYLRLWPWEERELMHGLVRVECPASVALTQVSTISRWLLAERAPLAAPDGRWDRLLYPIRHVETFLRAQVGTW